MAPNPFDEPYEEEHKGLHQYITRPIIGSIKIPRNRPCGCGSGIKAKRCCLLKLQAGDAENRRTVA